MGYGVRVTSVCVMYAVRKLCHMGYGILGVGCVMGCMRYAVCGQGGVQYGA